MSLITCLRFTAFSPLTFQFNTIDAIVLSFIIKHGYNMLRPRFIDLGPDEYNCDTSTWFTDLEPILL